MIEIGVLISGFTIILYVWLTWNYNHWKKMNIPYLEPTLFFGNIKDFVLMRKCKSIVYDELYRQSTDPALGIYNMRQPQLILRDPGLIKMLTVNEFSNFRENDVYTEPNDFFLTTNVFFFSGEEWKKKRSRITPALTMSKLKLFVPHMVEICRDMITFLDEHEGQTLEAKHFTKLYTMETALSYVYGVKCDSFKNPNSIYRKAFDEIFNPTWWNALKFLIANSFPKVGHFFKLGFANKHFVDFYTRVVKETIEYRKQNNVSRKDFLQFIMESSGKDGTPELSILEITGLTMNIAADGTETTSASLNQILDALIRYPEHQDKLREEIDLKINGLDDITYENVNSIPYLNALIHESLRILPPASLLEKKCTNDCEVNYDGRTYKFKKDDKFAISMYSLHRDPRYFPDPEHFEPERFMESDDLYGYSPFGYGPRACLGRPFAMVQMKVFLCALLKYFRVLPKDVQPTAYEFDPKSTFFLMLKGGVWIKVQRR